MKTIPIIICALMALCGGVATAQIDLGPDGIGVYFDTGATQVATTAAAGPWIEAYLIATNLSQEGGLFYWDAGVWPGTLEYGGAMVTGSCYGSYNYAMNMPGEPGHRFIALYMPEDPYPIQAITLLAQLNISVWSDEQPVFLFLEECAYAVESTGGPYIDFHPSSGSWDLPVAVINGDAPIPKRGATWGNVKSHYR